MSSKIIKLVREFGLIEGVYFYARLKFKMLGWFKSSTWKMQFFLRNNTTDRRVFGQVFIHKQYDVPILFEPKNILDLGANIGLSALYFAKKFPNAEIVALEPDKNNFEAALKNTKDFSSIKLIQMGVWNKNTFLDIVDTNVDSDAFMVKEIHKPSLNSIEATDIDTIQQQQGWTTIDILKIDIEGSEKELFSCNYEKWLPVSKLIFVEIHDQMRKGSSKSVFSAISKYNFSFSMKDENLIFINEDL